MDYQGRFIRTAKKCAKMLKKFRYETPARSEFIEPAVYVCRHSNNKGPVISIINMPIPARPWVYYVWCEKEACQKHCEEYTFSVRFGWSEWKTKLVARLLATPLTGLIRSVGSIPVYRNSFRVRETFRQSVEALKRNENLLIFPDVNYTTKDGDTGELYEGFLMLERFYFKDTGKHLPFVPLHVCTSKKKLVMGQPILFEDGVPYKEDKDRVIQALHDALNDLMENYGT